MTFRTRMRRAWPTTFGIHVFQMLLAGTFAVPLVASVSVPDVLVRGEVAAWIAAMRLGSSIGEETLRHTLLPLMAAALNYPWLSVAWLRSFDEPEPFLAHARFALARYRSAASIALGTLAALVALAAGAFATAYGLHRAFGAALDERTHDVLVLASVLPFVWLALALITLQDAAYAATSRGADGVRAALRKALGTLGVALVARRGLVVLAQATLTLLGWILPRFAFGVGPAADLGVLVVTQVVALLLTTTRAAWLASLTRPGSVSRALRAA